MFQATPTRQDLVPLIALFQNFQQVPLSFYMGEGCLYVLHCLHNLYIECNYKLIFKMHLVDLPYLNLSKETESQI